MGADRDEVREVFRAALGTPPPLGFSPGAVTAAAEAARESERALRAGRERRASRRMTALAAAFVVLTAGLGLGSVVVMKVRTAGDVVQSTPIPDGGGHTGSLSTPGQSPPGLRILAVLDRRLPGTGGSVRSRSTGVPLDQPGGTTEAASFQQLDAAGMEIVSRGGATGVLWARIARHRDATAVRPAPTTGVSCSTDVWRGEARYCRTVQVAGLLWVRVARLSAPDAPVLWTASTVVEDRLIEVVLQPNLAQRPARQPSGVLLGFDDASLATLVADLYALG